MSKSIFFGVIFILALSFLLISDMQAEKERRKNYEKR